MTTQSNREHDAQLDVASIAEWLSTKHTILWGTSADVTDVRQRERAAEWLLTQLTDWATWAKVEW